MKELCDPLQKLSLYRKISLHRDQKGWDRVPSSTNREAWYLDRVLTEKNEQSKAFRTWIWRSFDWKARADWQQANLPDHAGLENLSNNIREFFTLRRICYFLPLVCIFFSQFNFRKTWYTTTSTCRIIILLTLTVVLKETRWSFFNNSLSFRG